ncbi:MAG: CdaR family protein [Lachnospiraceae bacterium]|nr:CdaR family protein [Lachnospiraceae bacterium]
MKRRKIDWHMLPNKIKPWLKRITVNLWLKVVALVIAVFIWFGVSASNDPVRSKLFSNIPVTLINESSIADIGKTVEPDKNGMVTVKVTERRSVINRLTAADFYAEADLEMINGMNMVPLTVSCANSSISWDDMEIRPAALRVTVEDKVEQAFPVSVVTAGSPQTGLVVGQTEVVEGKTIRIAGPESLLKNINQVTVTVNVAGLSTNAQMTVALHVYDKDGGEFTDAQMSRLEFKRDSGTLLSSQMVNVKVTLWEVASEIEPVLNYSGTPAFGYRVTGINVLPATLSLAGPADELEKLEGRLEVSDLIDIEGASDNIEAEIDLQHTLAGYDKIKAATDADTRLTVTVQIEKVNSTTFELPLTQISAVNQPKNKKLTFTPADKILVTVVALEPGLDPIEVENLNAVIDLTDCETAGEYDIPVEIELPYGYELSAPAVFKVTSADEKENTSAAEDESRSAGAEPGEEQASEKQ